MCGIWQASEAALRQELALAQQEAAAQQQRMDQAAEDREAEQGLPARALAVLEGAEQALRSAQVWPLTWGSLKSLIWGCPCARLSCWRARSRPWAAPTPSHPRKPLKEPVTCPPALLEGAEQALRSARVWLTAFLPCPYVLMGKAAHCSN